MRNKLKFPLLLLFNTDACIKLFYSRNLPFELLGIVMALLATPLLSAQGMKNVTFNKAHL